MSVKHLRTLVVIPTYNELENLSPLLEAIFQCVPDTVEILVVDDASPDGTGVEADRLSSQHTRLHVLHRAEKQGLGTAYVAGFQWGLKAGFDALIEMDADFSHKPEYLKNHLELLGSYDAVIGSRYIKGGGTKNWGFLRRLVSRGGSFYARLALGVPIRDFTGGFNSWHRRVLEAVSLESLRSDGYSFQIELKYLAFQKGFKIKEFPILFEDRKTGKSKMSKKIVFEALFRVLSFRCRSLT